MFRKLLTFALFALAAALLAAVGYWSIDPDSFAERPAAQGPASAIDFYVVDAQSVQYQADGKLHYEMTADRLEHLKSSDITLVSAPELLLYRGSAHPWRVSSVRGEVSPQGKEIELIDRVRVERTDARGRPTVLTTSRLTIIPDKEYAQTQQAVRIEAANGVTTAQGMKAYLNDGRMRLLSNVRGQHEVR